MLVGILEDKDQFKRRFFLIAQFTRGAYGWSLLGIVLMGALTIAGLTAKDAKRPGQTGSRRGIPAHIDASRFLSGGCHWAGAFLLLIPTSTPHSMM